MTWYEPVQMPDGWAFANDAEKDDARLYHAYYGRCHRCNGHTSFMELGILVNRETGELYVKWWCNKCKRAMGSKASAEFIKKLRDVAARQGGN